MTIQIDTREPVPHPWAPHWPADVRLSRATLETGDVCLAALPDGAVIERKTVPDFLAAIGRERTRFERELLRSRYCGAFCIVVEGSFADVLNHGRALHPHSILGTVAARQRRYGPIFFAGSVRVAAEFADRYLRGQMREVARTARALAKAEEPTRR